MPKNMVNPSNGRIIVVADADVGLYEKMGYTPESFEAGFERVGKEDEKAYYEGEGQGLAAAVEGAMSGATVGLTDLVFDNEYAAGRAAYNPGARMVGELVGAIGGAHLPLTPAAKAASLGERAGALIGTGTKAKALAAGVEG